MVCTRDTLPGNVESRDLERDGKLPKLKSKSVHEPMTEDPAKRLMVRMLLSVNVFVDRDILLVLLIC